MTNKPEANLDPEKKEEEETQDMSTGHVSYTVHGHVSAGSNVGPGSVSAKQIAGRDLITINNGKTQDDDLSRFADKMAELNDLILEAREAGEIPAELADEALTNLKDVAEAVSKDRKPASKSLISKLQYIGDLLDTAADLAGGSNVATIIVRALPIAALLVKIATRIF